jgi:hypothetical protein
MGQESRRGRKRGRPVAGGGKEGVLLQSDIRQFSAKKGGKAKEPRSTVKVSEVPRKKTQSKKDPKRSVGLETDEKSRPEQEKEVQVLQETSPEESSEVRLNSFLN